MVRLFDLLRLARERDATDLHLTCGEAPTMRTDLGLARVGTEAVDAGDLGHFAQALLDSGAMQRLGERGDADAALRRDGLGPFRVHVFRASGVLRLTVRLLAREVPSLERLLLPAILGSFANKKSGLVLFAGPAGSGKTTSLAALIDRINRDSARHIVTIEDPVEYVHTPARCLVSHREIGTDLPDYATGVRSCLRADPDVILIGELRDSPTMAAALTAAETGHLVFATIHTGDAAQTIDRIVDGFNAVNQSQIRVQLAQTLVAVVSQRLVPRIVSKGRRVAVEILVASEAVRALIRDGKTHQLRNVIQTGRGCGMQTLESHLSELVVRGDVALAAARSVTDRPDEIRTLSGIC